MAQKLLKKEQVKLSRVERKVYPWEQWMDGNQWLLKEGEDFTVSVPSFRALVSSTAKRLNVKAATSKDGDHLILQAYDLPTEEPVKKTAKKAAKKSVKK